MPSTWMCARRCRRRTAERVLGPSTPSTVPRYRPLRANPVCRAATRALPPPKAGEAIVSATSPAATVRAHIAVQVRRSRSTPSQYLRLPSIMSPYGHEAAGRLRRRGREEELLAGGRAARGHPARGQPADPVAGGAPGPPAARSLRPPGRAYGGRARSLQEGAAHAAARGAAGRRARAGGDR